MAKTLALQGMIKARKVSIQPNLLNITYEGARYTGTGIIIIAKKRVKSRPRPQNVSRANAYAAKVEVMNTSNVVPTVMIIVFKKYREKSTCLNASR
jgi:hypothetical protein